MEEFPHNIQPVVEVVGEQVPEEDIQQGGN